MAVCIRQTHPVFVGEVSGVDLRQPLSRDEVAAIEAGMDRYAVLVFHDQNITDEQQIAFTRNFGELELTPFRGKVLSNMPGSVPNAAT
jgi:alpha-ketoglutarate-dependent 2,4-dichlorophenoxyacetate dioxygenase